MSGLTKGASDRMFSMGIWAWLAIVEKESDKLSEGAQNALVLLHEDLERLAEDEPEVERLRSALDAIDNDYGMDSRALSDFIHAVLNLGA